MAEVKKRKLYLGEGYGSMFRYCTRALHLSEHATYLRLEAARMVGRFPSILTALVTGALNLTSIRLLAPNLTAENLEELVAAARHRTRAEVEAFLARKFPRPDVPALVRKLPVKHAKVALVGRDAAELVQSAKCGSTFEMAVGVGASVGVGTSTGAAASVGTNAGAGPSATAGAIAGAVADAANESGVGSKTGPILDEARAVIAPLSPERFKVQFTVAASTHAKLRHAQDLLRHRIPNGDLSQIFDLALAALVEKIEKERLAATDRPRPARGSGVNSRTIPAIVKRAVWKRDDGQCAFIGRNRHRCSETGFLEFHHVVPFAHGGMATTSNIQLRCRAHNQYEAALEFGDRSDIVRESTRPWGVREPRAPWGVRESEAPWGVREPRALWGVRESKAPWGDWRSSLNSV